MTLLERLSEDLKVAMREKDELRRETLRMAISAIKNRRIELMVPALGDADELSVLQKCVKTRQESASEFTKGGRPELAAKELKEIEILGAYLPKQLSESDTRQVVLQTIAELGLSQKKQLGQLMKAVMAKHPGLIDGKWVNKIAAELLA